MRTPTRYILLVILIVLSGCAAAPQNYLAPDLPPDSLTTIADDVAPMVAKGSPAKSNSFIIPGDGFGRHLADNLRKLGYEVSYNHQTAPPEHAEVIRYTIDWVSPDSLYVALTVNNSQRYIRSYTVDHGTLTPDKTRIKGHNDER